MDSKSLSVLSLHEKNANIKVLKTTDYQLKQWKNGLGETSEMIIDPAEADFHKDEFVWRFCRSNIQNSCNLSLFPGYDVSTLVIPDENDDIEENDDGCALFHNDQAVPTILKPLEEYTYDGGLSTTCKLSSGPKSILQLMAHRKKVSISMEVETICNVDQVFNSEFNTPTNSMLTGHITIIYVIRGAIKVSIDTNKETYTIGENESLVCEKREDHNSLTDFTMTPLNAIGDDVGNSGDALVLFVQITLLEAPTKNALVSPLLAHSDPVERPPLLKFAEKDGSFYTSVSDAPNWTIPILQRQGSKGNIPNAVKHVESARHYKPPQSAHRNINESSVPPATIKDSLVIEDFPEGAISTVWINMVKQGLSDWIRIPVIVCRGVEPGPTIGITAVVHGNELNGVPCIHRVVTDIDVSLLTGSVVAVPCVNVPGYLRFSREFSDGKDLNRNFPGAPEGTASQVYNHNFFTKIICKFDYLIDLHTASFGRINSYYVRADMNDPFACIFAKLQQPQVILHNSGQDGTLRSAAAEKGIKAITVEIGNPQLFQNQYVQWSYRGVMRILSYLNMFKANLSEISPANTPLTIVCSRGFWIYTKTGGVLEVYPPVNSIVKKGDLIARIKNIFGNIVDEVYCPQSGVTIGKSSNPVAMAGDRILHLGVIKKENEVLASEAKENY